MDNREIEEAPAQVPVDMVWSQIEELVYVVDD